MKELPLLFTGPNVRAIIEGRKTQTRRLVKISAAARAAGVKPQNAPSPYKVGQIRWVKETACYQLCDNKKEKVLHFRADGYELEDSKVWSPSIFMPRWASRITLEITAVRVERVQDISAKDCEAEGLVHGARAMWSCPGTEDIFTEGFHGYHWLWDSINPEKHNRWESNPWVWVIEFVKI